VWWLFFLEAEDGIGDWSVTGVQTCALPILLPVRRWAARIAGPSSGPPPNGQHCWSVTIGGAGVPLHTRLFRWSWTVRLDYAGPRSEERRVGKEWRYRWSAGAEKKDQRREGG